MTDADVFKLHIVFSSHFDPVLSKVLLRIAPRVYAPTKLRLYVNSYMLCQLSTSDIITFQTKWSVLTSIRTQQTPLVLDQLRFEKGPVANQILRSRTVLRHQGDL